MATAIDAPPVAQVLIDTHAAFTPCAPAAHWVYEIHAWVAELVAQSEGVTVAELGGREVEASPTERSGRVCRITQMAGDPS